MRHLADVTSVFTGQARQARIAAEPTVDCEQQNDRGGDVPASFVQLRRDFGRSAEAESQVAHEDGACSESRHRI
jgi:hypothetical protein